MDLNITGAYRLSLLAIIHYENGLVELITNDDVVDSSKAIREMFGLFEILEPGLQLALTNRKEVCQCKCF